jgi:serine/threonine protein phosphatase PrpC
MSGRLIYGYGVAGVTCKGRRPKNEDALMIEPLSDGYLLAIADGVGGHHAGEVASGIAVDVLARHIRSGLHEGFTGNPEYLLYTGFSLAHRAILEEAVGERQGMGTTLVAALVLGTDLYVAHTGDSRAYLIHDGISFRTRDHSVIQCLVDKDLIPEGERGSHPLRCYLTRSLGGTFGIDSSHRILHPSDLLLLSSDGFHECIPESDIIASYQAPDLETHIRYLVSRALRSSDDNISIILYRSPVTDQEFRFEKVGEIPYPCLPDQDSHLQGG